MSYVTISTPEGERVAVFCDPETYQRCKSALEKHCGPLISTSHARAFEPAEDDPDVGDDAEELVNVYFESGIHAELACVIKTEAAYIACDDVLEDIAEEGRMYTTESVVYSAQYLAKSAS